MTIIGIDNGVTGTIGVLGDTTQFVKTPVFNDNDYTKKPSKLKRVAIDTLIRFLQPKGRNAIAYIERPMVNPRSNPKAVKSAIRALEATCIALEMLGIPYHFIDSKAWQAHFFGANIAKDDLKEASRVVGINLYPEHGELIQRHGDADGLLIARYAKEVLCTR